MSFDKLKGKMTEAHVSQAKLSEHLGITVQSLNAKLNGRTQFTLEEAIKITAFLNLKDPVDIFFSPSVPEMQQTKSVSKRSEQEVFKVWVPKWYWKHTSEKQDELERRVKRLELILLKEAQNKIASLSDKDAGAVYTDGYLTIEETINQGLNAR